MTAYFAHLGEDDDVVDTHTSTATETVSQSNPQSNQTAELTVSGGLMLGIVIFWWLATYVIKLKFPTRLLVVLAALLATGIACFHIAPITATIAIALGMALTLASVMLQLRAGAPKRK